MVRVTRLPGEFSTSKMRDSFLRQFVDQGNEFEMLARQNESVVNDIDNPSSKPNIIAMINRPRDKSRVGQPTRKSGVSTLLRCVHFLWVNLFSIVIVVDVL